MNATQLPDPLYAVVEIPKGRRNKYKWDDELGAIKLARTLFTSATFPVDYGFFPDTLAADGATLEAMVCVSEPTFPGCHIAVRPVGVLRVYDRNGRDDKVLSVPTCDPNWRDVRTLDDVPEQLCAEIAHFFKIYKNLGEDHEEVEVEGWLPDTTGEEIIAEARRAHAEQHDGEPQPAR